MSCMPHNTLQLCATGKSCYGFSFLYCSQYNKCVEISEDLDWTMFRVLSKNGSRISNTAFRTVASNWERRLRVPILMTCSCFKTSLGRISIKNWNISVLVIAAVISFSCRVRILVDSVWFQALRVSLLINISFSSDIIIFLILARGRPWFLKLIVGSNPCIWLAQQISTSYCCFRLADKDNAGALTYRDLEAESAKGDNV